MTELASLQSASDKELFRLKRAALWDRNVDYWLAGPLRHVVDVGTYIADRVERVCKQSDRGLPVVIDMGCGDAWLLRELVRRRVHFSYVGLDCMETFIQNGREEFTGIEEIQFEVFDFERPGERHFEADLVVNAFNFLELCELSEAFANASRFLRCGGTLQMSTIDKTYLMLAISSDWDEFFETLRSYSALPGTKYAFQPIDLGNGVSDSLLYPSVLYSSEDFIDAAREHGLELCSYKEDVFTASLVPKIYCHLEFRKIAV